MDFLMLAVAMTVGLPILALVLAWALDLLIPLRTGTVFYTIGILALLFSTIVFLITNPIFFPSPEVTMSLKRLAANMLLFAVSTSFLLAGRKKDIKAAGTKS